ncbi:hypothetical protein O181_064260 [Austropuccinia psidii MF-1]|uniref:Uncharacterized protein n=1 Tax=Austropuccinia psidii MF-1 TaxID=1389203 RepID=A0A9Q3I2Y9_9BASI|nr:hypothetical protein [Austropuccinia psidii MF-1]
MSIINLQIPKEKAKENVVEQIKTELTDDSLILGKGGGAAAIQKKRQNKKTAYVERDELLTNSEAELMAFYLFQEHQVNHINNHGPPLYCNLPG